VADGLLVEKRDETGTLRMRRMRKAGNIPAVLYGHGKDPVHLKISNRVVEKMVLAGQYVVSLEGAVKETALIKDVQWDAFGSNVMHIDFLAVDADEKVEVTVSIEFKGEAPGVNMGGVVHHVENEVTVAAPANNVPDNIIVNIDGLNLGDSISAGDLELPSGSVLVSDAQQTLVNCVEPSESAAGEEDDAAGEEQSSEPEVIGAKNEEENEDS
jgi:large subunit ribosomal protein L25